MADELHLHLTRIVGHRRTGHAIPWMQGPTYGPDDIDQAIDDYLTWRATQRDTHAVTSPHEPPLPTVSRLHRRVRNDLIEVGSPINQQGVEIGGERWFPHLAALPKGPPPDPEAVLDDFNVDEPEEDQS